MTVTRADYVGRSLQSVQKALLKKDLQVQVSGPSDPGSQVVDVNPTGTLTRGQIVTVTTQGPSASPTPSPTPTTTPSASVPVLGEGVGKHG